MSELWPLDVRNRLRRGSVEAMRPFKCVLLMPFEIRFNPVAQTIEKVVKEVTSSFQMDVPEIQRLDWVTSSGVVQQEIWREIHEGDLVFCDVTGYNPNVMFESGVCAAWKDMVQVVFIRDHFFRGQSPFDTAPIRYTEYSLISDGVAEFEEKVRRLVVDALVAFPDRQGKSQEVALPVEIDFNDNLDDLRIYTPPFAHRRVVGGALEFGSLWVFPQSWASIGKEKFLNFSLEFSAKFSNPLHEDSAFIGVGVRSQHYYANYAHIFHLKRDGSVIITEPNEHPPRYYEDHRLREATPIDLDAYHEFCVTFDKSVLMVQVDDFMQEFEVGKMQKVFGPGLIRFQASRTWMAVNRIALRDA